MQIRLPSMHACARGRGPGRTPLYTRIPFACTDPHVHGSSYTPGFLLVHRLTAPPPPTDPTVQQAVTGHPGARRGTGTQVLDDIYTCLAQAASQGHTWPGDSAQSELGPRDTPSGSSLSGRCMGLGVPGWASGPSCFVSMALGEAGLCMSLCPPLPGLRPHPGSGFWAGWGAGATLMCCLRWGGHSCSGAWSQQEGRCPRHAQGGWEPVHRCSH